MSKEFDEKPTFLAYSKKRLSVVTGGGLRGYESVVVHKPVKGDPGDISMYPEQDTNTTFGVFFAYGNTARIHIDGCRKWINYNLSDAPQGRQDIKDTGKLRIELFDSEELKAFIEENRQVFQRLGLKFIQ